MEKQNEYDEKAREELLQRLINAKLLGATSQVFDIQPSDLPARELPPGSTATLFLMYLAFCRSAGPNTIKPAGKSTFYNVAQEWKVCLTFRPYSQHSMCAQCQALRSAIHEAEESHLDYFGFISDCTAVIFSNNNIFPLKTIQDFETHADLCDQLLRHFNGQWLDRRVYWAARDRSFTEQDLMTVIIDSFDRSKLVLPQWPYKRVPKRPAYEAYNRLLT